ncbi:MAG: MATE family efflux transporter [Tissierellia bacterium]|nr:MATE family efflux transporter [Tissierellia bacterium]
MQYRGSSGRGLRRQFYKYLIPSIGAMWFFSIYTMIDGIFVGRGVGPDALASVNLSMPFISTVFAVSLLFSVGSSTFITYYLGKGDKKLCDNIFTMNILITLSIGIIISILSLIFLDKLVVLLGASHETLGLVKDYLKIIIIFSPFFMLSYTLEVLVKSDGHPGHSLIFVVISALTNIILDYILVIKYDYGIKGAAYATGISQFISFVGYMSHFLSRRSELSFVRPKINFHDIRSIIRLGFPEALTEFSAGFATFMFNFTILKFIGYREVASFSVIMYMNNLVISTMVAINQGMQPLVSFYHGSSDKKCIKKIIKYSVNTTALWGFLFFITSRFFADEIVSFFISQSNTEIYKLSVYGLKVFSISFLLTGFNIIISGFLTALKVSKSAMLISSLRGYIIISASLIILPNLIGDIGIWGAAIMSEFITLLITYFIYKKDSFGLKLSFSRI